MNRRRVLGVVLVCLLAAVGCVGPALAQYAQGADAACDDPRDTNGNPTTSLVQGQDFVVQGRAPSSSTRCGDPGSRVEFVLTSSPVVLGATTANSRGDYTSPVLTIPRDTTPGSHTISANTTLNGRAVSYSRAITVTGAAAGGLPTTGRDIALLTLWGIFLVGFGSVLISASWKRWRAARIETAHDASVRISRGSTVADAIHHLAPTIDTQDLQLRPVSTAAIPIGELPSVDRVEGPMRASVLTLDMPEETEDVKEELTETVVSDASSRTAELVSRLQDEIKAWSKPQE